MTPVIICINTEACPIEHSSHLIVPACVLTQAMGYLNNGLWVRDRPLVKGNLYVRVIFEGSLDRKLRH
jgi:hypothetical protein